MSERFVTDTLRTVSADIDVSLPPVDAVIEAGQRHTRNRRFAIVGAAAASVALVAGTIAVIADVRSSDDSLPAGVVREDNPLPGPWYHVEIDDGGPTRDGTLHLDDVALPAANLDALTEVGDGAVVWASLEGRVTLVEADGRSHEIGQTLRYEGFGTDPGGGLVAWLTSEDDGLFAVLYDVRQREELGRIELPVRTNRSPGLYSGVGRIEDGFLYYVTIDGVFRWQPGGDPEPVQPVPNRVDEENGVSLIRVPRTGYAVRSPEADEGLIYQGILAPSLSTDGSYIGGTDRQTRTPTFYRVGAPEDPIVSDLYDRKPVPGLGDFLIGDIEHDWLFVGPDEVLFVVQAAKITEDPAGNDPDFEVVSGIVACDLEPYECEAVVKFPMTEEGAVHFELAR